MGQQSEERPIPHKVGSREWGAGSRTVPIVPQNTTRRVAVGVGCCQHKLDTCVHTTRVDVCTAEVFVQQCDPTRQALVRHVTTTVGREGGNAAGVRWCEERRRAEGEGVGREWNVEGVSGTQLHDSRLRPPRAQAEELTSKINNQL